MDNKKIVKILKKLVANHNDRIVCYEMGVIETDEAELKAILSHFVQVSKVIKEELSNEIRKSGGVAPDGARQESKFLLAWADVNKALDKKELDEIFSGLEECEKLIITVYDNVLADHEDDFSTEAQIIMIESQQKLLEINLKELTDLRNLLVHHK